MTPMRGGFQSAVGQSEDKGKGSVLNTILMLLWPPPFSSSWVNFVDPDDTFVALDRREWPKISPHRMGRRRDTTVLCLHGFLDLG